MIEQLDFKIDVELVKSEINKGISIDYVDQILLQTVKGKDPFYGSRAGNEFEEDEFQFCEFFWPEMTYTNSILEKFGLVRSRIMNLKSKTCLSYHKDPTPRFHMPIITNENCFLIIDKKVHHLSVGKCYIIDSTLPHTAVNASFEDRLHIIGSL